MEFKTKEELFKYLKENCSEELDEIFVLEVRTNILRGLFEDQEHLKFLKKEHKVLQNNYNKAKVETKKLKEKDKIKIINSTGKKLLLHFATGAIGDKKIFLDHPEGIAELDPNEVAGALYIHEDIHEDEMSMKK